MNAPANDRRRSLHVASSGVSRAKSSTLPAGRLLLLLTAALALLLCAAPIATAAPPTVTIEAASNVRYTSAAAKGEVDPGAHEAFWLFQYATQSGFENGEWEGAAGLGSIAAGSGPTPVEAELTGMHPGATYHVRLLAENTEEAEDAEAIAPSPFTTEAVAVPGVTFQAPGAVTAVSATTAHFSGQIDPMAPESEQTSSTVEAAFKTRWHFQCTPECPGSLSGELAADNAAHEVSAEATGLVAGVHYEVSLVAENAGGEASAGPVPFTALSAVPTVSVGTAVEASETAATLRAEIDPGHLTTGFHLEYVTEAQFEAGGFSAASVVPVPDAELPAASEDLPVLEHLTSLQPETTYHFRFAATNARGPASGPEATFATNAIALSFGLPDGRVDELVSTAGNFGEPYVPTPAVVFTPSAPPTRLPFQAAADGNAVAYIGEPGLVGGNGNTASGAGNQWLATRTPNGWTTEVIVPPSNKSWFQGFSENLSSGIVYSNLELAGGAQPGCSGNFYSRSNSTGSYTTLLTSTQTPGNCGKPLYAGSDADGSQVIFQSEAALTPGSLEATEIPEGHSVHSGYLSNEGGEGCMFGCNLYLAQAGALQPVNVLPGPEGETVPNATFGGYPGASTQESVYSPADRTSFSDAISNDGSRIFWTDTQEGPQMEHVYVLENHETEVQVSGSGPAEYWAATPDGRYAYYTEAGELWRFDTHADTREVLAGPGAGVLGVLGVNQTGPDGSYLYFVAKATLASNTVENGNGPEGARPGQPNLYLLHEGVIRLVAPLAFEDNRITADEEGLNEDRGDWVANLGSRTAELTPDGTHLLFVSVRPLTGYDNFDPLPEVEAGPIPEAFTFSADQGTLACASCDPTGSPPSIPLQTTLETPVPISSESFTSMRRWISDDGNRVFFNSLQPLVRSDLNGVQDVYEWEREGEGACSVRPMPRPNGGCVFLLSQGNSSDNSYLVDADADGENVFFEHRGSLDNAAVPADANELYDARVDGGFRPSGTECGLNSCAAGPAAGPSATTSPASLGYSGPGNPRAPKPAKKTKKQELDKALASCRKRGSKQARQHCEKKARAKFGTAGAQRTKHDRRSKG